MVRDDALPLSAFIARPFADHPVGTLLILTPWRSKPAPLCLGIKVSGIRDRRGSVDGAYILQGSPYGAEGDFVGELATEVEQISRTASPGILGLSAPLIIEIGASAAADQSRQRFPHQAVGFLAIGANGVRLCGGVRIGSGRAAMAVNPHDWTVEGSSFESSVTAFVDTWSVAIDVAGSTAYRMPVRPSGAVES